MPHPMSWSLSAPYFAAALAFGYLLGSIPFGVLFTRLAGLGAFLGHLFPVWLGFKGGKGVATYLGLLIAFSLPAALVFGAVWLGTAALTRYSSLSALLASLISPVALAGFGEWQAAELFVLLTVLVYAKHVPNIRRLLAGTESRIGRKS